MQTGQQLVVLQATQAVTAGQRISTSQVEQVAIRGDDLRAMRAVFVDKERQDAFLAVPLAEAVVPGQLLTQRAFRYEGTEKLPLAEGQRAISFKVRDESRTLLCLVGPGSVVDVVGLNKGAEMQLIMRAVTVLAIGESTRTVRERSCNERADVTVAVAERDMLKVMQDLETAREVRLGALGALAAAR
jgi:Flp pilus assembly protein CpaB